MTLTIVEQEEDQLSSSSFEKLDAARKIETPSKSRRGDRWPRSLRTSLRWRPDKGDEPAGSSNMLGAIRAWSWLSRRGRVQNDA